MVRLSDGWATWRSAAARVMCSLAGDCLEVAQLQEIHRLHAPCVMK